LDSQLIGLGALFALGTVMVTWAIYFAMHLLVARHVDDGTKDLAGSVIFRVSSLHGLILALVFAQELLDYNVLRTSVVREATAVADIYNDIRRYGADTEAEVQRALADYTREVVDAEWAMLGTENRLTAAGWRLREAVYEAILDLTPATPRQESLREHMMAKVQLMAELRQERENSALHQMSALFWFAAIAGVALVTVPYFVFAPTVLNVSLLSIYGAYTGLVMFIIFAFSNPFTQPGALHPEAFERLLETEIGRLR
jgi:hypothetical protein